MRPIGILYEHPEWFRPLFAELDRRGLPYERVDATTLVFDPADPEPRHSLLVNRMSPSAWTRGHESAIFQTLHYLAYLDRIGAPVLNGLAPTSWSSRRRGRRRCSPSSASRIREPGSCPIRRAWPPRPRGCAFPCS